MTTTETNTAASLSKGGAEAAARPTFTRHIVLWMVVAVYLITYLDRVVMSAAVPSIQEEFGFDIVTMGWILGAFSLSYALFQIPGGWLGDRFGPRRVLTGIVMWWSMFTLATAFMWSAGSMMVCRFLFGMGEAGAFPNATRALSRWMLPSERGWAQGLTHAGARIGGATTPVLAVLLITAFGWRAPFILFAGLGIIWALVWFFYYRDTPGEHKDVNEAERELIETSLGKLSGSKAKVPWARILAHRQTWLLSSMYFCYGYVFGTFLAWFPKYIIDERGLSLLEMGFYASLPLVAGVAGDMVGGGASDYWLKRTGNLTMARKVIAVPGFLVAAAMIPLATLSPDPTISIAIFCVVLFALELTVGVSWAVALDIGGEFAGSVSAIMNTAGNIGGTIAATLTAYLVAHSGWSTAFFVLAALSGVAGVLFIWIDAAKSVQVRAGGDA